MEARTTLRNSLLAGMRRRGHQMATSNSLMPPPAVVLPAEPVPELPDPEQHLYVQEDFETPFPLKRLNLNLAGNYAILIELTAFN